MTTSQIAIKDNNATIVHTEIFGSTKMSTAGLMISKSRASELSQTTSPENATAVTKKSMITVSPQTTPKNSLLFELRMVKMRFQKGFLQKLRRLGIRLAKSLNWKSWLGKQLLRHVKQRDQQFPTKYLKKKAYSKVPKTVATDSTPKNMNESPITVASVFENVSLKLSAVRLTAFEI